VNIHITIINAETWAHGIAIRDNEIKVTIRGFKISSLFAGIAISDGAIAMIYNCIIKKNWSINGIMVQGRGAFIYNCIVDSTDYGVWSFYVYGCLFNSIILNCNTAYREQNGYNNWILLGWNLYWNNVTNFVGAEPSEGDIFENPLFENDSYLLNINSPAINTGKPDIFDRDGSRSDIGIFGGPYAY